MDFRIKVKADLDSDDLKQQLNALSRQKAKIGLDLDVNKSKSKLKELTKKETKNVSINVAIKNAKKLKELNTMAKQVADAVNNKNIGITIDNRQAITAIRQVEKESSKVAQNLKKHQQSMSNAYWKNYFQSTNIKSPIFTEMADYYKQMEREALQAAKISKILNSSSIDAKITSLNSSLNKYSTDSSAYKDTVLALDELKQAYTDVKVARDAYTKDSSSANFNSVTSSYEKLQDVLTQTENKLKILRTEMSEYASSTSRINLTNQIQNWLDANTRATKEARQALESYIQEMNIAGNTLTKGQLNNIQNNFKQITSDMKSQGKVGTSWASELRRATSRIAEFASVYGIIQNVAFEIPRQVIQAVKDIDAAQIELIKVSNASESQLSAYWEEAAASAKKYGAAINEVINNTADWSRLGYSLDEAKKLSDATTLIQRVGDNMTQELAAQGVISTLKGFQLEAKDVNKIVDEINEVANTQPIDTAGIFAGLERSASSMSAANNTLEETIALITAANSVVQDPASVGTAFKTLSMRIRGAETDLEAAGLDTEGMAESTAKLREEIKALSGVDIMLDTNTFKSTYDILDELSAKWSDLTNIQQANSCLYAQKCA